MTVATLQDEQAQDHTDAMKGAVQDLRKLVTDAVTSTRQLVAEPTGLENPPSVYDRVRLLAGPQKLPVRVLEGAHDQLAAKLDIPKRYYERMLTEAPDLLATNINTWHQRQPGNRLVRMLRPSPTQAADFQAVGAQYAVRAVLSDRYRALDYGSLLDNVLPVAQAHGLTVAEWKLTDTHFFVRFNAADQAVRDLLTPDMLKGIDFKPGWDVERMLAEQLSYGVALRNSETGHGALLLEPMFKIRYCFNQIIVDWYRKSESVRNTLMGAGDQKQRNMRTVHIGRKLEEDANFFAADTQALDAATQFLKVRDSLQQMLSDDTKQKAGLVLAKSMATEINLPEDMGTFQFIDGVSQTFDLSEDEQKVLKEEVLKDMQFRGAPLTPFAISQGITAMAKVAGRAERKDELEHLGWRVLEDPVEKLVKAAKAALN